MGKTGPVAVAVAATARASWLGPRVRLLPLTAHMSTMGTALSSSCTPLPEVEASDTKSRVAVEEEETASGGSGKAPVPERVGSSKGAE